MGGEEAVAASVESFYDLLKADPLMFRTFEPVFEDETGTRSARFKAMMAAWMCTMAEGNCWYEGLSMSTAHSHMDITEQEFDVMMVHLDDAMELNSVGELERQEMIDLFNDMKYQVVQ
jgi:hemoglobin